MNLLKTYLFGPGILALALVACEKDEVYPAPAPIDESARIEVRQDAQLGSYLADDEGMALYIFSPDVDGSSACSGGCAQVWPVYFEDELEAGSGIAPADLGEIIRPDGSRQTTYKGWPLYYFAEDENPGVIKGDGLGGHWFVAKPDYDVMVAEQNIDGVATKYLVDDRGRSLYRFTQDEPGKSKCQDGCLAIWPPFSPSALVAPSTVDAGLLSFIDGNHGESQLAFDGQPLYHFAEDVDRGDVIGQGVGDAWFVLSETEFTP